MLLIPKAVFQIHEQDPQGMGGNYFSLKNQTSLVQASQTPDKSIKMHSKVINSSNTLICILYSSASS